MKINLYALMTLLTLSSYAEVDRDQGDHQDVILDRKGNIQNRSGSNSRQMRDHKKVGVHLGALYDSVTTGFSFGVSYLMDKDTSVELTGIFGDNDNNDNGATGFDKISNINFSGKFYMGNTFYLKPGVELHNHKKSETKGGVTQTELLEGVGITFAVGNQWQWDSFHLGCDWIGGKYVAKSFDVSGTSDRGYLKLLNLYIGTTF